MPKKKKKKNGKIKKNGNVGGKADVHLSSNGGRNKSLLGHNAIFTPEVIDDIHIKSQFCLLYTSPSPRDGLLSRMPSSA